MVDVEDALRRWQLADTADSSFYPDHARVGQLVLLGRRARRRRAAASGAGASLAVLLIALVTPALSAPVRDTLHQIPATRPAPPAQAPPEVGPSRSAVAVGPSRTASTAAVAPVRVDVLPSRAASVRAAGGASTVGPRDSGTSGSRSFPVSMATVAYSGGCSSAHATQQPGWCFRITDQEVVAKQASPRTPITIALCRPAAAGAGVVSLANGHVNLWVTAAPSEEDESAALVSDRVWELQRHPHTPSRPPQELAVRAGHCTTWTVDWDVTDNAGRLLDVGRWYLGIDLLQPGRPEASVIVPLWKLQVGP